MFPGSRSVTRLRPCQPWAVSDRICQAINQSTGPGGGGDGDGDGGSPKRARMGHVMKASILFLGDYCQIRGLEGKSEAVCASQLTACDDDGVGRRAHLCRPVLLPTSKSLLRGGRASKSARSSLSFPPSWIQLSQPWTGLAGPCPGGEGAISRKSCLFVPTFWSSSLLFFPLPLSSGCRRPETCTHVCGLCHFGPGQLTQPLPSTVRSRRLTLHSIMQ